MSEKLQKVLARAGLGSRRKMETVIAEGRVSLDGKVVELGERVTQEQVIRVDGVQAAKASLLEIRLESRWFHSKLLSKPSLVFGFPKAWLYPRWVHGPYQLEPAGVCVIMCRLGTLPAPASASAPSSCSAT